MCAKNKSMLQSTFVQNVNNRSQKHFRLHSEVDIYFLKKLATEKAIAEYKFAMLHYMQSAAVKPQQYADDLISKSRMDADVYDEGTLNDVIIESRYASIGRSL